MKRALLATVVALTLTLVALPGLASAGPGRSATATFCQENSSVLGFDNAGACVSGFGKFQTTCERHAGTFPHSEFGGPSFGQLTPVCEWPAITEAAFYAARSALDGLCASPLLPTLTGTQRSALIGCTIPEDV